MNTNTNRKGDIVDLRNDDNRTVQLQKNGIIVAFEIPEREEEKKPPAAKRQTRGGRRPKADKVETK
jgi:hypothetical protein